MQIQEISNSHLEIQQDGTSASTDTTGTQGVHTVPGTPSYSQKVLDFQGIAIGIKTILNWRVISSLVLLIYALGYLWFAVKHDDPSLLAPLPLGLIPGMEVQAPLEPKQGIEVLAPLEPKQGIEVLAPLEPKQGIEVLAPLEPKQGIEVLAPLEPKQGIEVLAPLEPKQETEVQD